MDASPRTAFLYLLVYRWISLVPPLAALFSEDPASSPERTVTILALAAGGNLIIHLFHGHLNRLVRARPVFFGVDLLFCAGLVTASGASTSPYYLYTLSPVLGAAFFFQWRGGLAAAAILSALFGAGVAIDLRLRDGTFDPLTFINRAVGYFLIGGIFGYPSVLLERLHRSGALLKQLHDELAQKNAALEKANRLALALQSVAVDIRDVQEYVLRGIVRELGYPRAIMALLNHRVGGFTRWLAVERGRETSDDAVYDQMAMVEPLASPMTDALRTGEVVLCEQAARMSGGAEIDRWLNLSRCAVVPLQMRGVPVGVILVELAEDSPVGAHDLAALRSIAEYSSLALWTTELCIRRARQLATQEERDRIAREIHDTVSQSLFGFAYTLEGCVRLLPGQPEAVREKLAELHALALRTMGEMRRSIFDMWLGELTTEQFADELHDSVRDVGLPDGLQVDIRIDVDVTELSPLSRKHLFRIAQEALTNVVRHANATRASVCLEACDGMVRLTVADDGKGFHPEESAARGGFGLSGIRERVRTLGGSVSIQAEPERGTRLEVAVPKP